MPRYGTTSHPLFGFSAGDSTDNLRATVFSAMPEHGHAYSMGIWAGYYDAGDPGTAKLALYGTSSGNPSSRRSYTNSVSLNTRMVDASDGQSYDNIDLLEAVALSAGSKYGLAALLRGGRMAHGQNSVADQMYRRDSGASNPPDPMGYTSSPTETQMTIWVNYEANVAPNTPSNLSPADGASFTDTTPTYAADFRDDNETLPNGLSSDFLNAYQIQVRSVASDNATTGTIVWDSGVVGASGSEQTNRRLSMDHAGSALTPGQRYQWCCRVQDRFGAWSSYTAWTDGDFLVSGAAVVTLDGTPTGRTTDTTPDFQGKYHHVSGTSSSHVQVRLYIGATLVSTSPEIAKVVASAALPGTSFTITAAESAFGTLASGVQYSYQMRAKASSVWSEWTAKRAFKTNTAPTTPTSLVPSGGAASTTRPLLTFCASDADGDSLTGSVRIKDGGGTLLKTRTATYDAALYSGAGGYKYQTTQGTNEVQTVTITGSPTGGTFTLTYSGQTTAAIAYNANAAAVQSALEALSNIAVGDVGVTGGPGPGTPYVVTFTGALGLLNVAQMTATPSFTGGSSPNVSVSTTTAGVDGDIATYATYKWDAQVTDGDLTSAWSGEAQFIYAQGPTVTVTSPTEAEEITTDTPTIAWTTTDQQKKQIRVWRTSDDALVHDSGLLVNTDNSYDLPSDLLVNNTDYYLTVAVTDSNPLTGTSAARNFRLEYTPPPTILAFNASAERAALDLTPSVIRMTWDQVITLGAEFQFYRIYRRLAGQEFAQAERMIDIPSIEQTTWTDTTAPAGVDLIYSIVQSVRESLFDIVRSDPADSLVRLDLSGSVLSDVRDGLTTRVVFDHVDERTETPIRDQTEVNTWDGGAPWLFEGPTEYTTIRLAARLIHNDAASVEEQLAQLRAICGRRADKSPVISCYRDERKRKKFGRAKNLVISDQRLLRADVEWEFTELTYSDVPEAVG